MFLNIKFLYRHNISYADRLIFLFCFIMLLLAFASSVVNGVWTHYLGNNYLSWQWLALSPLVFVLLGVAFYAQYMAPRLAFFTRFYTLYYLIVTSMGFLMNGIQYTPFPTVDGLMVHLDQMLGINTVTLITWTAQHPLVRAIFTWGYEGLTTELFVLPIFLALLMQKRALNEYLIAISVSFILGALIYYFFPTAAPSSQFHSAYFLLSEQATSLKFYQIHHYIAPTTSDGGMIAFPSFHVIYAVLCVYVVRHTKFLLIPLLILNSIAVLSTVMLGWHYFIDVLGGSLLALFVIGLVRRRLH